MAVRTTAGSALASRRVTAVAAGSNFSLALCSDDTVAGWGANSMGQLGIPASSFEPMPVAANRKTGGLANRRVKSISAGRNHAVALCYPDSIATPEGAVVVWGQGAGATPVHVQNLQGKTTLKGDLKYVTEVAGADGFNLAFYSDGTAATWQGTGQPVFMHAGLDPADAPTNRLHGAWTAAISQGAFGAHKIILTALPTLARPVPNTATYGLVSFALNLDLPGRNDILERGVLLRKVSDPVALRLENVDGFMVRKKTIPGASGTVSWDDLTPNIRYEFIAYASTNTGTVYSDYGEFRSPSGRPQFDEAPVAVAATPTGGELLVRVASDGGLPLTDKRFIVSLAGENREPTRGQAGVIDLPAQTSAVYSAPYFWTAVSGLQPATVYACVAMAENAAGITYSPYGTFTTAVSGHTWNSGGYWTTLTLPDVTIAAGSVLNYSLGRAPELGRNFTIVNNTGVKPIAGTFSNVANGATVTMTFEGRSYEYVAWYHGGDGNDLVFLWKKSDAFGWGNNTYGQAGPGASALTEPVVFYEQSDVLANPTAVQMARGEEHSVLLLSNGHVMTAGRNDRSQLGNLLDVTSAVAVAAGGSHTLLLGQSGGVSAFGANDKGQLGNGGTTDSALPVSAGAASVLFGKVVISISAGHAHSMAATADGLVAVWGDNSHGQLGLGTGATAAVHAPVFIGGDSFLGKKVKAVSAGKFHSLALCTDGTVFAWGENSEGQAGVAEPAAPIYAPVKLPGNYVAIAAGGAHSLALHFGGGVLAWGRNLEGQLGNGTTTGVWSPEPNGLDSVATISAGLAHSTALLRNGKLLTWGRNDSGELGRTGISSIPAEVSRNSALAGVGVSSISQGSSSAHSSVVGGPSPAVIQPVFSAVTPTTADLGGTVSSNAGQTILARGVAVAKTSQDDTPMVGEDNVMDFSTSGGMGAFTV
ncbi:MAG: hypothetical protein JNG86_07670, partial [Verrucomicrobiaceae bacterium]|nr:hypothetical protein [Verrucomicrobiaceae bacterium]